MGKRPKWLPECRLQAHLTTTPVVLYCVSMGTVVPSDPNWGLLRTASGVHVWLFSSCCPFGRRVLQRWQRTGKQKFTQRKRKGPSLRHITHTILKASNKISLRSSHRSLHEYWMWGRTSWEDKLERGRLLSRSWHNGERGGHQLVYPSRLEMKTK